MVELLHAQYMQIWVVGLFPLGTMIQGVEPPFLDGLRIGYHLHGTCALHLKVGAQAKPSLHVGVLGVLSRETMFQELHSTQRYTGSYHSFSCCNGLSVMHEPLNQLRHPSSGRFECTLFHFFCLSLISRLLSLGCSYLQLVHYPSCEGRVR